jgi:hypothetical protein
LYIAAHDLEQNLLLILNISLLHCPHLVFATCLE